MNIHVLVQLNPSCCKFWLYIGREKKVFLINVQNWESLRAVALPVPAVQRGHEHDEKCVKKNLMHAWQPA